jgi:hypothetical protein
LEDAAIVPVSAKTGAGLDELKSRFRRIRCAAPDGKAALDWRPFDVIALEARDWGLEALVSNFDEEVFERFRGASAPRDLEVASLSLEEIFVSVTTPQGGRA